MTLPLDRGRKYFDHGPLTKLGHLRETVADARGGHEHTDKSSWRLEFNRFRQPHIIAKGIDRARMRKTAKHPLPLFVGQQSVRIEPYDLGRHALGNPPPTTNERDPRTKFEDARCFHQLHLQFLW